MQELSMIHEIGVFLQVILIDLTLAADNAVVIGLAAAGLEPSQRKKAIIGGIVAATLLRILFASVTVQLLQIVGLVLAGGILLLWVCWKMWAELHPEGLRALFATWRARGNSSPDNLDSSVNAEQIDVAPPSKTLRQAVIQIVIADISMSIDNVLAVAGAAREHPIAMVFGLVLSIGLMGAAAMIIARLHEKHKWIAYLGLVVVLYVAIRMIYDGSMEVGHVMALTG